MKYLLQIAWYWLIAICAYFVYRLILFVTGKNSFQIFSQENFLFIQLLLPPLTLLIIIHWMIRFLGEKFPEPIICPKCGKITGQNPCSHCGYNFLLDAPELKNVLSVEKNKRNRRFGLILLVTFLFLVLLSYIFRLLIFQK